MKYLGCFPAPPSEANSSGTIVPNASAITSPSPVCVESFAKAPLQTRLSSLASNALYLVN